MSVGEAGTETGEESCGSEVYALSTNEEAESEATSPTVFPLPPRENGSVASVRFCGAGREEDRLNIFVKGT